RGTWSAIGGSGVGVVGIGGAVNLQTVDGDISLGSDIDTRGGSALGGALTGAAGGAVTLLTDATGTPTNNHLLTANSLASIVTTGGAGSGAGDGGTGGAVILGAGGDITLPIAITTTGGSAVDGAGGKAGNITITVSNTAVTSIGDVLI